MQVMGKELTFYYLGICGQKELVQVPALNETEARMEFVKNIDLPFDSDTILIYTDDEIPKNLRHKLKINTDEIGSNLQEE